MSVARMSGTTCFNRIIAASVIAVGVFSGSAVRAEPPVTTEPRATDNALAQGLFEEALGLMKDGHFVEACPKLAESHRLDPGGGTVFNLAICLEKEGKTASAYVAYDEALARAVKDLNHDRESYARDRLAYLKPLLSKVVVKVAPAMIKVEGLDVRFDGASVRPEAWGIRVPVDPGVHMLTASAPSYVDHRVEMSIEEPGKVYEIEVPPLQAAPKSAPPPPTSITPPKIDHRPTIGLGLVVGGGALAALGVASGVLAATKHSESDDECKGGAATCTPAGVRAEEAATRFAWGANIGIGLGLVAMGVGTYLLLSSNAQTQRAHSHAPRVRGSGLSLSF